MFDKEASFTIVYEDDAFVLIVDNDYGLSVTNDAERVCQKILTSLTNRKDKRILYRDTMGQWDEMVHNGFSFSYFFSFSKDDPARLLIKNVESKGL